ncbi:MAG: hypothetical protein KGH61_02245 [Candidatus Micrarchaeota archaeon]|nr:hypothetical protein [Candidatus Micrarchaeota archaeon]MDE1847749.1 hypothetical protein [Candidatus Micrarchaeota archaeon]MDE1863892.1 hypothetical protein [Candidatus Micrarchaeota archaeon]
MENIAVLSHNADMDGVGAAAMVKMKYGLDSGRLFFSSYGKESVLYAEKLLRKFYSNGFTLFITDLSMNEQMIATWIQIIKKIKARGGRVIWFDHHPWGKNGIAKVARLCDIAIVGENERYCATEIARRELSLDTPFIDEFCRIVHHSDFNLRPRDRRSRQIIKEYALSITSFTKTGTDASIQKKLRHMAVVIGNRRFTDQMIEKASAAFERKNNMRIEKMLKGLHLVGKSMAIGFASGVQSTHACSEIIRKSGRDIGVIFDLKTGKGSIRSVKSDISALAVMLHGGGHPHAAGFEIRRVSAQRKIVERIASSAAKLQIA